MKKPGDIGSLSDLPARCWTDVPNSYEGTQFFTRVGIGGEEMNCMLDSGSMVNTITEA